MGIADAAERLQAFRLDGRIAVVTGAGRGIGAALALALGRAGASVVVNDVEPHRADQVAQAVEAAGARASSFVADIGEASGVEALVAHAVAWGGAIDVFVCNAAVTSRLALWDATLTDWERVLRVNLTGSFLCAQAAMRVMRKQPAGGRMIFVGSGVAHQGALLGHAAYAASKAGVHALAKTADRIGAPFRITANVIAPGATDTELLRETHSLAEIEAIAASVPLGIGEPSDVGYAAAYLAADAGRHLTGATIDVNGGQIIR